MTAGKRSDSASEKIERRAEKANRDIKGWESELNRAAREGNKEHMEHAEAMIEMDEHALEKLENGDPCDYKKNPK